jgi:hypothetical protein
MKIIVSCSKVLHRKARGSREITHHFYFYLSLTNHDDHPDPIFWRLYLRPQLRYNPSAASTLSPTPVAIDRWLTIFYLLCSLLLRKPNPTAASQTTKWMLWCCFHITYFTDDPPSSPHHFRIVLRSGGWNLGPNGEFVCSKSVFLYAKNNKNIINYLSTTLKLQMSGPKPPPTHRIHRVHIIWVRQARGGEF